MKKISIIIGILFVIFLFLYYGLNLRYFRLGLDQVGFCESVKDSKFIKVFYFEYKPNKNDVYINDNIKFKIKEVWVEDIWMYTNDFRTPDTNFICMADVNVILITKKGDLKNHRIYWRLEDFGSPYYKQNHGKLLIRSLKISSLKDTMDVKILTKNPKTNEFTDSVGVIRFFKVKDKNVK